MESEFMEAKKKAMALLQHMDRTEWQLRDKLSQKGFSEDAVEEAIEYVRSYHYIDDLRYAVRFVEFHYEQRSMQRLRQDLYKRHVSDEYIETALDTVGCDDSIALQEAVRRLLKGREADTMNREEKQKLMASLYRKGFRTGDIMRFLDS